MASDDKLIHLGEIVKYEQKQVRYLEIKYKSIYFATVKYSYIRDSTQHLHKWQR